MSDFCNPVDCSPPGSSVHGTLQAATLEWVAMPFSRGSSQPRDLTHISYASELAGRYFTSSAVWDSPTEVLYYSCFTEKETEKYDIIPLQ